MSIRTFNWSKMVLLLLCISVRLFEQHIHTCLVTDLLMHCARRKENKDKLLRQTVVKKLTETKENTQTIMIKTQERQIQCHNSYKQWKISKNKKLRETKTQFTYNPNPRQPPKASKWRPARSIQYTYPSDPSITKNKQKTVEESYTSSSFEEEEEEIHSEHDSTDGTGKEYGKPDDSLRKTGHLKTIKVCCQTIEYWCTCKEQKIEE